MTEKTSEEIRGLEYDWLAVDANGHVALFSTAGGGYAPPEFLRDTDLHDAGIDALMASPRRTTARFFPKVANGLPNAWKSAAESGAYAFDSDPSGGAYRLVASPEIPALIDDFPESTRLAAKRVHLADVSFQAMEDIGRGPGHETGHDGSERWLKLR